MYNNQIVKMAQLCELIKVNDGTTSSQVQKSLNISRRTFFRYLDNLRDMGANIGYNKIENCYKLEKDFDLLKYYAENIIKPQLS